MNEQQFENAVARMVQGDKTGLREIYEAYIGYGIRQSSLNREAVTRDILLPWPEIWRLILSVNTGKKN